MSCEATKQAAFSVYFSACFVALCVSIDIWQLILRCTSSSVVTSLGKKQNVCMEKQGNTQKDCYPSGIAFIEEKIPFHEERIPVQDT